MLLSLFQLLAVGVLPIDHRPEILGVGMVTSDTMAVTIREGSTELGKLVPYEAKPNDVVTEESLQRITVKRNGKQLGTLAGQAHQRMLRLPDKFIGSRIDRKQLLDPRRWKLSEGKVRSISFKTRVLDAAQDERGGWKACFEFIVFLTHDRHLTKGEHSVVFAELEPFRFEWDDTATYSPAIHVSALGYRPDDPAKPATLSCWLGDGMSVDYLARFPGLKYRVVENESGTEVLSGQVTLGQEASQPDDYKTPRKSGSGSRVNRFGGRVFHLPLHELKEEGVYRVVVDGVGSSKPFPVARDVYDALWKLALRGLHVHRRNVTLKVTSVDGESWTRPASDDSDAVYSTARMGNANFNDFVEGATDRAAPGTKGGWMDAGDFDSNPNHYWISLMLLDLVDRHPQKLSSDGVGISDSGNGIPDLLDEGLWMIECYRKMLEQDGTVTSGIEYAKHPRVGEPSHLNSLPIYRLAPSPRSSYLFAAAAARAARVISNGEYQTTTTAKLYLESAASAFAWAEMHRHDPEPDSPAKVEAARLLASCELLTAGKSDEGAPWIEHMNSLIENPWGISSDEVTEAIVSFLRHGSEGLTVERKTALTRALYQKIKMSYLDGSTRKSGFGVLKNGWAPLGFGSGGCPGPGTHHTLLFPGLVPDNELLPPHIKPNRDEHIAAGVTGLAFILGHHPTNRPFVTGLESLPDVDSSWESVHNILHL
ncbi:MAG: glycoside hydrolase family 9 protein, partial [Planctomycetota bacterium]